MASNASDDCQTNTSTLSTARSDPTAPTNLQRASDHSLDGDTDASTTDFQPDDYADVDWKRLLGYHLPHLTSGRRRGATWKYGYDIEHGKTGKRYWLCRICHKQKAHTRHIYLDSGTANHSKHMQEEHSIGGDSTNRAKQGRSVFEQLQLQADKPEDQARINTLIQSLNSDRFTQLLMRWVVRDNIPFHKLESSLFRDLMGYANQAILTAGLLPTHSTMRELIIAEFNRHKEVVTALLRGAPGKIHLSFDLWTSRNYLSLLGKLSFRPLLY